jgi:hypothetical protein
MKRLVQHLISSGVQNDLLWKVLDTTLLKPARFAQSSRTKYERDRIRMDALERICPDLVVRNGVFKGMKYPEAKSIGSVMFPKLLGCYERELDPTIESICQTAYTEIVDIGCAEGYYAVGLAMRIPTATVYAYDTNREALQLCRDMARLNGVDDRVVTDSFCGPDTLATLPLTQKGLIFCDCEGYEKQLFTKDNVGSLSRHDLVVEVHDGMDLSISSSLHDLFTETHHIEMIDTVNDTRRLREYKYEELEPFDLDTRLVLIGEFRVISTGWLHMTAK